MIIIIKDELTGKRYKIKPMSDGMSYRIFINDDSSNKGRNGIKKKHQWQFSGYYPTDIEYAIDHVVRLCMLDDDEETEVSIDPKDIKSIKSSVQNIRKAVDKRIRELVVESATEASK